jgi:RimJ/RimL family protein N-acetyltransferase
VSQLIISYPELVFAFINKYLPMSWVDGMKGIGLVRTGKIVAGVVYEGYNTRNIWMHGAVEGGRVSREFVWAIHYYPFVELGVDRISTMVRDTNDASKRVTARMGYEVEARLRGAADDGSDTLIFVLRRQDCRFLGERYGKK